MSFAGSMSCKSLRKPFLCKVSMVLYLGQVSKVAIWRYTSLSPRMAIGEPKEKVSMYLPNMRCMATRVRLPSAFHQYCPISRAYGAALQPFSISTTNRNIRRVWYSPHFSSKVKYAFCRTLRTKVFLTSNFAWHFGQTQCSFCCSICQLCPQSMQVVRPLGNRCAKWLTHSRNAQESCAFAVGLLLRCCILRNSSAWYWLMALCLASAFSSSVSSMA